MSWFQRLNALNQMSSDMQQLGGKSPVARPTGVETELRLGPPPPYCSSPSVRILSPIDEFRGGSTSGAKHHHHHDV